MKLKNCKIGMEVEIKRGFGGYNHSFDTGDIVTITDIHPCNEFLTLVVKSTDQTDSINHKNVKKVRSWPPAAPELKRGDIFTWGTKVTNYVYFSDDIIVSQSGWSRKMSEIHDNNFVILGSINAI